MGAYWSRAAVFLPVWHPQNCTSSIGQEIPGASTTAFRTCSTRRIYGLEGRVRGGRIQVTLGTKSFDAAVLLKNGLERALAEGATSGEWARLHGLVPEKAFWKLAGTVGYTEEPQLHPYTFADLTTAFAAEAERLIVLGKLRTSTWDRYQHTVSEFREFLSAVGISELA
jgi:hypothetical protein